MAYQCFGASISVYDCCRWFTHQRKTNTYFANLNSQSARATIHRLDTAFSNFFRRVKQGNVNPGYPRFKAKGSLNSFVYSQYGSGVRLTGNRLYVHHIGTIRVRLHRPVEGVIKTVTIKQEAGKWYVIFSCVLPDLPLMPLAMPLIGIDLGLTHFLTTSDGIYEPNPRYLKIAIPELRRASRSLSRKKERSSNRRKAIRRLQCIYARVCNLRREHHYQVARRLVLACDLIAVERLDVQSMLRSGRFSRAISDAGWSSFLNILRNQAEKAGVQYVDVDPRGTSQQCSQCGQEVPKDLSVRRHDCSHCGLSIDRDHNAARNILARGLARVAPAAVNVDH
jgi:putative transposase